MARPGVTLILLAIAIGPATASYGETPAGDQWSTSQTLLCGDEREAQWQREGATLEEIESALGVLSCSQQTNLPPALIGHGGTIIVDTHPASDSHGTRRFSGEHHRTCAYVRTETGYTISPCDWRQRIDVGKAVRMKGRLTFPPVKLEPPKPQ